MIPRWAEKLEAQNSPPQDTYSVMHRVRRHMALLWVLAVAGGFAGRWLATVVLKLRLAPSPAAIVAIASVSGLCLFGLWYIGKRWGARVAGALMFVALGLFGTLTFSLLLALDP